MTTLSPHDLQRCYELGKRRNDNHANGGNHQHTSEQVHVMGLKGEVAFANRYGLDVDTEDRPTGDDHDFQATWIDTHAAIDVKATRYYQNPWLKVKTGNVKNDVYVLAAVDGADVELVGWATKDMVKSQDPTHKTGHVENYVLESHELNELPKPTKVKPL